MDILKDIENLIKNYKDSIGDYRHDIATYDDDFALEEKGCKEALERVVKDLNKLKNKVKRKK